MNTNQTVVIPSLGLSGKIVDFDLTRDEYELRLKSGAKMFVPVTMTKPIEEPTT